MPNISARETAYRELRRKIIHLELKPGEALNDKELAEQMGLSRTPVREAIIMLNIAELVTVRPQSGTFVSPIDMDIVDMEQFDRYAQEKEVLRRACRRIQPKHKALYEENFHFYEFYERLNLAERPEKLLELDNAFHRIAFAIDGKEQYFDRMQSRMQHVERLRMLSLMGVTEVHVLPMHRRIAEAILSQDVETAERLHEQHMTQYQEDFSEIKQAYPHYFR